MTSFFSLVHYNTMLVYWGRFSHDSPKSKLIVHRLWM